MKLDKLKEGREGKKTENRKVGDKSFKSGLSLEKVERGIENKGGRVDVHRQGVKRASARIFHLGKQWNVPGEEKGGVRYALLKNQGGPKVFFINRAGSREYAWGKASRRGERKGQKR